MLEAWFRHVEERPYAARMLFGVTSGDPDIEAEHTAVHQAQVASDVALLRTVRPSLPEEQLEPLGEVIRASLAGLALWWLDHPDTPRSVLVASMRRVVEGMISSRP